MIIVSLTGGLGNQLFQYAAAKALAVKRKQRLVLDFGGIQIDPNPTKFGIELDKFMLSCDTWMIYNIFTSRCIRGALKLVSMFPYCNNFYKIVKEDVDCVFQPGIFENSAQNIFLNGCWQSFKYFDGIEEELSRNLQSSYHLSNESKAFF